MAEAIDTVRNIMKRSILIASLASLISTPVLCQDPETTINLPTLTEIGISPIGYLSGFYNLGLAMLWQRFTLGAKITVNPGYSGTGTNSGSYFTEGDNAGTFGRNERDFAFLFGYFIPVEWGQQTRPFLVRGKLEWRNSDNHTESTNSIYGTTYKENVRVDDRVLGWTSGLMALFHYEFPDYDHAIKSPLHFYCQVGLGVDFVNSTETISSLTYGNVISGPKTSWLVTPNIEFDLGIVL